GARGQTGRRRLSLALGRGQRAGEVGRTSRSRVQCPHEPRSGLTPTLPPPRTKDQGPMTKDQGRTIRVGHSPDSDDAFMFYALAHDKLETGDLRFVPQLEDIETLNRRALNGELEVSAVSIHAYAHLADR